MAKAKYFSKTAKCTFVTHYRITVKVVTFSEQVTFVAKILNSLVTKQNHNECAELITLCEKCHVLQALCAN